MCSKNFHEGEGTVEPGVIVSETHDRCSGQELDKLCELILIIYLTYFTRIAVADCMQLKSQLNNGRILPFGFK